MPIWQNLYFLRTMIYESMIKHFQNYPDLNFQNPDNIIRSPSINTKFQHSVIPKNSPEKLINFYDDFSGQKGLIDRDKFDDIQKWFLNGVYEHFACQHTKLINPIEDWTIMKSYTSSRPNSEPFYAPMFSVRTPYYPKGNLYDHMRTWKNNPQNFNEATASIIIYGIARALLKVQLQGFETHNLSPFHVYLTEFQYIDMKNQEYNLLTPTLCNIGFQTDRNIDDPLTLRPSELEHTTDKRIIRFLVLLYLLFQKPELRGRSIVKDFYGIQELDIEFDYMTDNKIINNAQLFLFDEKLYEFDSKSSIPHGDQYYDDSPLAYYINVINTASSTSTIEGKINKYSHPNYFQFLFTIQSHDQINFPFIREILASLNRTMPSDKKLAIYEYLAIIYSCGYLEDYVDYRLSAYFANKALEISKHSPTIILTKFPNCYFPTNAELLFHEGEVLEGNAMFYAEDNDPDAKAVLEMAAKKYKESALQGFDRAKTRLAIILLDSGTQDKELIIRSLLIPASRTDPAAKAVLEQLQKTGNLPQI